MYVYVPIMCLEAGAPVGGMVEVPVCSDWRVSGELAIVLQQGHTTLNISPQPLTALCLDI